MPDPLLPSDPPQPPPPSPSPEPRDRPARISCGFCGCTLVSASGDVLRMSDTAKQYRDAADDIETLQERITSLEADLKAAIDQRDAALQPPTRKDFRVLSGS